jgi:uncharacterized repeat protein (TIGR02543 family)
MTKANSALNGWYREATFSNKWNFTTDTVTADITLHAKWEPVPIPQYSEETITFGEGGGNEVTYNNIIFKGTFTDTEWLNIVASIRSVLVTTYSDGAGANGLRFRTVFVSGVTIIVEKNPAGYSNYMVGGETLRTLYLNGNSIESIDYRYAVAAMASNDPDHVNIKG